MFDMIAQVTILAGYEETKDLTLDVYHCYFLARFHFVPTTAGAFCF